MAELYKVELPPKVFERGFWLYAWKIVGPGGERFCYVGMTGDVTGVAQSPFGRASGHFGSNKTTNQIRRRLWEQHGIEPEECRSFEFVFYGPLFPYEHQDHRRPKHPDFEASRRRVLELEARLISEAVSRGHRMLNQNVPPVADPAGPHWDAMRDAFAPELVIP